MNNRQVRFYADGPPGSDGSDGSNGSHGSGSGASGGHGQPAGLSTPGQNAGSIELSLFTIAEESSGNSEGAFTVDVQKTFPSTGGYEVDTRVLSPDTDILLSCVGGAGGNGGRGGNGGDGAKGRSGSGSSNGGPGGQGGDAGHGSSGSRGGNGGSIGITVNEHDSYLLMAIPGLERPSEIVKGGLGGRAGAHGSAGAGGRGGRGGSGSTYTDGQGHTHHRPAGRRGRNGSPGSSASAILSRGADGTHGSISVVINEGDGVTRAYDNRYMLQFGGMLAGSDEGLSNSNIVFQFGDTINLSKIMAENVGPMPSPIQPTEIKIRPNSHMQPVVQETSFINRPILSQGQLEADGCLQFYLPIPSIRSKGDDIEPHSVKTKLVMEAWQMGPHGFSRRHNEFDREGMEMELRFPVENLLGFEGLSSIQGGRATKVKFAIRNSSLKDLGIQSTGGRKVYVQVYQHESPVFDNEPQNFKLSFEGRDCDALCVGDKEAVFRGEPFPVEFLERQKTIELTGSLWISPSVEPYSRIALQAEIVVEDLPRQTANPSDLEEERISVVQNRQLLVVSEPTYYPSQNNQAVLVTSSTTTKEEFCAWKQILTERLGLAVGYYSVSIYGSLRPDHVLDCGLSLAEAFKNKLVVVLDRSFNPLHDGVSSMCPSSMLPNGCTWTTSGFDGTTRWLMVGTPKEVVKQHLQAHYSAPPTDLNTFASVQQYLASQRDRLALDRSNGRVDDLEICEDRIVLMSRKRMSRHKLSTRAIKVAEWIRRNDRLRQYIVRFEWGSLDPETKKFQSSIIIRRGYHRSANSAHVITGDVKDAGSILSGCTVLATARALPYSTLLKSFCWCARESNDPEGVNICLDAIVDEIVWDVCNLLESKLKIKDDVVVNNFPSLVRLSGNEHIMELVESNTEEASAAMSKLVARLTCVAESKDLRPRFLPSSRKPKIAKQLRDCVDRLQTEWRSAVSEAIVESERKDTEKKIKKFLKLRGGSLFPSMPRRAGHWRKGLIHVCSFRDNERKEYGPKQSFLGAHRLLEMESPNFEQKLLPSALLTAIHDARECRLMSEASQENARLSTELLEAVREARTQNENMVAEAEYVQS